MGRSKCKSPRTGNVSPGATSRLGIEMDPLPPGVASCAITAMVMPRMCRWLALRKESATRTSN